MRKLIYIVSVISLFSCDKMELERLDDEYADSEYVDNNSDTIYNENILELNDSSFEVKYYIVEQYKNSEGINEFKSIDSFKGGNNINYMTISVKNKTNKSINFNYTIQPKTGILGTYSGSGNITYIVIESGETIYLNNSGINDFKRVFTTTIDRNFWLNTNVYDNTKESISLIKTGIPIEFDIKFFDDFSSEIMVHIKTKELLPYY